MLASAGCKKIEPERIFKVETSQVSEVSNSVWSATGTIIDIGEEGISQRGFCYATHSNPTITDYDGIVQLGATISTGDFFSNLTDLLPESSYHVKAYISNGNSTTYGKALNLTTKVASDKPTVITSEATSVEETTALVGGNISSDGGSAVTERGIYYGTSSSPNTTGAKVAIGTGTGNYSTTLTGLTNGTEYFITAYATNSAGTAYGSTLSFTTDQTQGVPTVSTNAVSAIGETTATVGGLVSSDGGATVTERGIYYGTSSSPQTTGVKIAIGNGTGNFSTTLTGLSNGTEYFFVAYAINSAGTAYGTTLSFTTDKTMGVPEVTTNAAYDVGETAATVGGDVTSDGGATVSERGIYYGTSSDPQATGSKVAIGNGTGAFTTTLTGLIDGITYYFVAYATNSAGTAFGTTRSFDTNSMIVNPTVTTSAAYNVGETAATVGGDVTSDGGAAVSERGVYYGTSSNPQTSGTKVALGNGTGTFTTTLTGLTDGVTYYFVAYATNSVGTAFGTTRSFDTNTSTTVTDRDGNVYNTVKIGEQIWMSENLKVTHYPDGSEIQLVEGTIAWDNLGPDDKAYCWYNNSAANGEVYGAIYTWAAAANSLTGSSSVPSGIQGVCPDGWHLPSDEEWKLLEIQAGMSRASVDSTGARGHLGGELKETGFDHWNSPNYKATNSTGFTAFATGLRKHDGSWVGQGLYGNFWTATDSDDRISAWVHGLDFDDDYISRAYYGRFYGFPVRCIKD